MYKHSCFTAVFLSCAVLAGTCWAKAETVSAGQFPTLNGTNPWGHGWGVSRKVFKSSKPAVRKRIAALDHMAHVHAAVRGCLDIEIAQENIERLFASDGLGPLSPAELGFVGGRISDYKEYLKAQADEEICEWAYENYGPNGVREKELVRSRQLTHSGQKRVRDPETTSGLPRLPTGAPPSPLPKRLPAK